MKLLLAIRAGHGEPSPFETSKAAVTIGRAPKCDLSLADPTSETSWQHARIDLTADGAFVTDLKSTNGTFLNNTRVDGRAAFKEGDEIRFGISGPVLTAAKIQLPAGDAAAMIGVGPAAARTVVSPARADTPNVRATSGTRSIRGSRPYHVVAGILVLAGVVVGGGLVIAANLSKSQPKHDTFSDPVAAIPPLPHPDIPPKPKPPAESKTIGPMPHEVDERPPEKKKPETSQGPILTPAEVLQIQEREAAERALWRGADVVFSNPAQLFVGLRVERNVKPPRIKLMAKSESRATPGPLHYAWENMIPVSAQDPLTARLYDRYQIGQAIEGDDARAILDRLRLPALLPAGKERVSFVNRGTKERRVGYLLGIRGKEWDFCNLVPRAATPAGGTVDLDRFEQETISEATQIEPGSARRKLNQTQVKDSADFLDYCVNEILDRLQTPPADASQLPIRPCVFVHDPLIIGDLINQRTESIQNAIRGIQSQRIQDIREALRTNRAEERSTGGRGFVGVMAAATLELIHELQQAQREQRLESALFRQYEESIKSLKSEYDHLLNMHDAGVLLAMELRSRLVQARVRVVDWSEESTKCYTRAQALSWKNPSASDAVSDRLVEATHVLIPEIHRPIGIGEYHLAVRLVNLRTGTFVFSDDGDRALRRTARSGVYRNKSKDLAVRLVDAGGQIKLTLEESPRMSKFELTAVRNPRDNSVEVKGCVIGLKADPRRPRYDYHTEAVMRFLTDKDIELEVKWAILFENGQYSTRCASDFEISKLVKDEK